MQDLFTTYLFFLEHLASLELSDALLFASLVVVLLLPCYALIRFVKYVIRRISDNYNN